MGFAEFDSRLLKEAERAPTSGIHVRILPGDKDVIVAAEIDGRIVGRLELRLVPLVHDMEVDGSLIRRRVAEALWNYAQGYVRASHKEALILVAPDNQAMLRWMADRGYVGDETVAFNVEVR